MRSSLLEVIHQDYIRTARAKGLSEALVIGKHALRNALIPIITLLGLSLPFLLGGAVIVETVFSWPGMGKLTIDAIFARDYPLIIGCTLVSGVMVILGNLLADILYAFIDPRIRYD
jgi:peptide/nickel transport system permease protein